MPPALSAAHLVSRVTGWELNPSQQITFLRGGSQTLHGLGNLGTTGKNHKFVNKLGNGHKETPHSRGKQDVRGGHLQLISADTAPGVAHK